MRTATMPPRTGSRGAVPVPAISHSIRLLAGLTLAIAVAGTASAVALVSPLVPPATVVYLNDHDSPSPPLLPSLDTIAAGPLVPGYTGDGPPAPPTTSGAPLFFGLLGTGTTKAIAKVATSEKP